MTIDEKKEETAEEANDSVDMSSKVDMNERDRQGSPPPPKAMPPKPKDLQLPPPTSRPPSTTSTHSASSNGAPRTTTSRRGGRTRSRSPPTMRSGSINGPERDYPDSMEARNHPISANPSSAAAAAAAAAKALSNTGGGRKPDQWYEGDQMGGLQRDHRSQPPHAHLPRDHRYSGVRNWPGEDQHRGRAGYRPARPLDQDPEGRYSQVGPGPEPYPTARSGSGSQGDGYYPPGRPHYDQYGGGYEDDGRRQDSRGPGSFERDEADRHYQRYGRRRGEHDEYYRGPGGIPRGGVDPYAPNISSLRDPVPAPPTVKRSGGTTRVIGTATPIHVPRAADPPGSGRHNAMGTASSVFRGLPEDDLSGQPGQATINATQINMSMRTPSASFEEQPKSRKSGQGPPLSPVEPPQILHSHHQNQMEQALFFDQPNRSPKAGPSETGGVEMAPSFSLFNQSFDSLGDTARYLNESGTLDVNFNSASFGVGPSSSNIDVTSQLLPAPSNASFAVGDRIFGSSSAGMTFGISPINSFGNGPPSNPSRPVITVLGGQPESPVQMLDMYPSYSGGGYGGQGGAPFRTRSGQQAEQNPMHSLGSGSISGAGNTYGRSYDASPHSNYSPRQNDGPPGFYAFLGRNKAAFVKCSFLLPGLKAALLDSPISDSKKGDDDKADRKISLAGRRGRFAEPTPHDTALAVRRVASAICAFGGSITGDRRRASSHEKSKGNKQSIFREKDDGVKTEAITVTPSSSTGTPPGTRAHILNAKHKYDEQLPSRYYENENRLSWEFEESPPVGAEVGEETGMSRKKPDDDDDEDDDDEDNDKPRMKSDNDGDDQSRNMNSPTPSRQDNSGSSPTNEDDHKDSGDGTNDSDQPKMRYRCKLCGLPKQNHTCTFQQSLQRSIGVMIYPAVNAFTSSEPGLLAPTLTDMNNFVNDPSSTDTSPSRPTPDRRRHTASPAGANVTPETMRSSTSSPAESLGHRTPLRTPGSSKRTRGSNLSGGAAMGQRVGTGSPPSSNRKRSHGQMSGPADDDLLFVETVDLKPEQFRIVTPSKSAQLPDAYTYPSLPLPYAQRKRLSDNLFALSKEIPQLTDECAVVLREAREKDMWDLAVSELMTQVVVVIHCHENDCRFEGLRHYLLTLGIAC